MTQPYTNTSRDDIDERDGVLGPKSEDEPMFYEVQISDGVVKLTGPSPGMVYSYNLAEFEQLVDDGEWELVDWDHNAGCCRTPDGELAF